MVYEIISEWDLGLSPTDYYKSKETALQAAKEAYETDGGFDYLDTEPFQGALDENLIQVVPVEVNIV